MFRTSPEMNHDVYGIVELSTIHSILTMRCLYFSKQPSELKGVIAIPSSPIPGKIVSFDKQMIAISLEFME